jgi:hypothetical protein
MIGLWVIQEVFQSWNLNIKLYFEIELFHVAAIVLPIPEMYGCSVHCQKKKKVQEYSMLFNNAGI